MASPRYHQSNDTVPPSFNLNIFSWVETWIHQRCFRNVFGWVVMVSFENEKYFTNRTAFGIFDLTSANTIYTSIWVTHHLYSNHPHLHSIPRHGLIILATSLPNSSSEFFHIWGMGMPVGCKYAGMLRRGDTRNPFSVAKMDLIVPNCPKSTGKIGKFEHILSVILYIAEPPTHINKHAKK